MANMAKARHRVDPVKAKAIRDRERGSYRKRRTVDASVAYAPFAAGLATGLAAILHAPNKTIAIVTLGAGMSVGAVTTFWDRHKKKHKETGRE
jgi:hypothetical protein